MKTAKSFLKEYDSQQIGFNYEKRYAFETKDVIEAMKEYAKEAIKADRENVAKHAKANYKWNKDGRKIGYGEMEYFVEKDSIINAPEIELK